MILSPVEQSPNISPILNLYLYLFVPLTTSCILLLSQMVTQNGKSLVLSGWQSMVAMIYKLVSEKAFLLGFSAFCLVNGALLHGSYCAAKIIPVETTIQPVEVLCQAYAAVTLKMFLLKYLHSLLCFSLIYVEVLTLIILVSLIWSYLPISWTGKLTGDWGNIFQKLLIDFRFIQAHLMVFFVTLLAVCFLGNYYHSYAILIVYLTLPLYALYFRRVDPEIALTFFTIKVSSLVHAFFLVLYAFCILRTSGACVNIMLEIAGLQLENIEIIQKFSSVAPHGGKEKV